MNVGPEQLLKVVVQLLMPLSRFCLRHGLKIQDIAEALKLALVRAAVETTPFDKKPNLSRISVMTGVHRKDVNRLTAHDEPELVPVKDVVTKVVGLWQTDRRFRTKNGDPKVLTLGEQGSEFEKLVSDVSQDLRPAAILYELLRNETVSVSDRGIRLIFSSYTPKLDVMNGFQILGSDMDALVSGAEENILNPSEIRNLHASTVFDRIREDSVVQIREWLLKQGHELHRRCRDMLSKHDQDTRPEPGYKGRFFKFTLGTFSHAKAVGGESHEKK